MHYSFQSSITLSDRAGSPYNYLPFYVPPDAGRVTIRYSYSGLMPADEAWGGNTIDLGLFGPGGIDLGSGDFRGWSGSGRTEVFVTATEATPAYLPGLPAGLWHVLLGAYNISQEGCRYTVDVEVARGGAPIPPSPPELSRASLQRETQAPAPASPRWFKGDLHCHTVHSDGEEWPRQVADAARARGLDFLAITDHNTSSHLQQVAQCAGDGFLPIPAEEITTYTGHANVWGIRRWVDFRCATVEAMRQSVALAHQQGALFSINHPKDDGPPWGFGTDLDVDCMEVWQAPFWVSNYQSLALWDSLLRQGRRVTGVGGSDLHRVGTADAPSPYPLGSPTTWVYASALTVEGILDGLRRGHVMVTADANWPGLEFTAQPEQGGDLPGRRAMMGDEVAVAEGGRVTFTARVRGAEGCLLRLVSPAGAAVTVPINVDDFAYTFTATPKDLGAGRFPRPYLRPEVIQPPEADLASEPGALIVEALGNPIWVSVS